MDMKEFNAQFSAAVINYYRKYGKELFQAAKEIGQAFGVSGIRTEQKPTGYRYIFRIPKGRHGDKKKRAEEALSYLKPLGWDSGGTDVGYFTKKVLDSGFYMVIDSRMFKDRRGPDEYSIWVMPRVGNYRSKGMKFSYIGQSPDTFILENYKTLSRAYMRNKLKMSLTEVKDIHQSVVLENMERLKYRLLPLVDQIMSRYKVV